MNGVEYTVLSQTEADILQYFCNRFGADSEENCKIKAMQECDESLENYYINLVGGKDYE